MLYADPAYALADWTERPPLFDEPTLRASGVPVSAVIYDRDLFVDAEMSRATVELFGAATVTRVELEHDALRRRTVFDAALSLHERPGVA